jgi:hypothetical protein
MIVVTERNCYFPPIRLVNPGISCGSEGRSVNATIVKVGDRAPEVGKHFKPAMNAD